MKNRILRRTVLAALCVPALIIRPGMADDQAGHVEPADSSMAETVHVVLETEMGDITLALYPDRAPVTVTNFLKYLHAGYYDGGYFYRVVRPDNDNGAPPISVIQAEAVIPHDAPGFPPIPLEDTNMTGLLHEPGTVSMARDGPDTATHSFFITLGRYPGLDAGGMRNPDGRGFAAFGRVADGMDVVRAINRLQGTAPVNDPYYEGQILSDPVTIRDAERK